MGVVFVCNLEELLLTSDDGNGTTESLESPYSPYTAEFGILDVLELSE